MTSRASRWFIGLVVSVLAGAGLMIGSVPAYAAPPSLPSQELPPCAANDYIFGVATKTWANGDFKILLFPTYKGRGNPTQSINPREITNDIWHLTQACVPDLYGSLADSIYKQIECHVQGGWVKDSDGTYKTGGTWDLESWTPVQQVGFTTACGSTKGSDGPVDEGSHTGKGAWRLIFGPPPMDMIEDSDITMATPTPPTYAKDVWVFRTGGLGLWTRTGPGGQAGQVGVLPEGTHLTLLCQAVGETIAGPTTSALWDYVRLDDGREYWVSDVFVLTGSDGQIAPTC